KIVFVQPFVWPADGLAAVRRRQSVIRRPMLRMADSGKERPGLHRIFCRVPNLICKPLRIMRLIIFLMVVSLPGLAQPSTYGDFRIFENRIIYQHVFDCSYMTVEQLDSVLRATPSVKDVQLNEGTLTATLSDFVVDYKKFKFPQMATPHIIQTGRSRGKLTIQVRDGRY